MKDFTNDLLKNAKAPVNTGAFTRVKTSQRLHEAVITLPLLRQIPSFIFPGARSVGIIKLRRLIRHGAMLLPGISAALDRPLPLLQVGSERAQPFNGQGEVPFDQRHALRN